MDQKETVSAGLLDFPRKKLPDSVWLYEDSKPLPRLKPELRARILSEARKRLEKFGAELIGSMLYGGAATYQYHEGADIDVSLYIDWDDFKGSPELLAEAFKTVEIPWGGFKLHLFVKPETEKEQFEIADAVYDVYHDEWKLPPLVLPKDFDPEVFFQSLQEMAEQKAEQIDILMGHVSREWAKLKKAVRTKSEGARDEDVVQKRIDIQKTVLMDEIEELVRIFDDVWENRYKLHEDLRKKHIGDQTPKEFERFQYPEVVWKYLDQAGYAEFLKVLSKAHKAGVIEKLLNEI